MHLLATSLIIALLSFSTSDNDIAQKIVDDAIKAHGGKKYEKLHIGFKFRKYLYEIKRNKGEFKYQRTYNGDMGLYTEVLDNDGVSRQLNAENVELNGKTYNSVKESINSQVYFALLPFALNDAAVNKEYLGEAMVEGEPYHKIKVTFDQEGGGEDFEDVFIYWFHKEKKTMDYLAYEFHVNKGGFRFRKAYNSRKVGGIIWQDYINYKESDATTPLEDYDQLLEQGKLIELSRIELEDVKEM
ncbi:MAG: hypothetical protein HKN68_12645 [Saprospiraceae bacterium]|nr:hypothetical protein [Saprospiraceae bacterium]